MSGPSSNFIALPPKSPSPSHLSSNSFHPIFVSSLSVRTSMMTSAGGSRVAALQRNGVCVLLVDSLRLLSF